VVDFQERVVRVRTSSPEGTAWFAVALTYRLGWRFLQRTGYRPTLWQKAEIQDVETYGCSCRVRVDRTHLPSVRSESQEPKQHRLEAHAGLTLSCCVGSSALNFLRLSRVALRESKSGNRPRSDSQSLCRTSLPASLQCVFLYQVSFRHHGTVALHRLNASAGAEPK
jgi:hypothetical protein